MAKSNETIEECLKSIDRRLIENKEEHKNILNVLKETASKKVDQLAYDNSLRSSVKDRELVEIRVDRAWNELVEMKEKDEAFRKELAEELAEIKKLQAVKMSNISYVVFVIGVGATMFATKVWDYIAS